MGEHFVRTRHKSRQMQSAALFCLLFVSVAYAGLSEFYVPEFPTLGNPVHCLTQESRRSDFVASGIRSCALTYCSCQNGTFNNASLQCTNMGNAGCSGQQECFRDYTSCLEKVSPGCTQAVTDQCEELFQQECDEGSICINDGVPRGLSAGGILAIAAGIVYLVAFIIVLALMSMAKKQNTNPQYEDDEE
eukprot:NODE_1711_length_904_cov_2888.495906_g1191_i0.p1 GENE.NODE_1711_length_904_cov_2888.495906_g1191_i0~~NODE_1711_length_904_cov_2888.495906_g1191_i0.p1  ORF type:complete len:201 (+),score=41.03 NODE_1711_length_904_cov_2888.495906_g1191_i0:34-603(+)